MICDQSDDVLGNNENVDFLMNCDLITGEVLSKLKKRPLALLETNKFP